MAMCSVTFHRDLGLQTFYSGFRRRGRRLDRTSPFWLRAVDRGRKYNKLLVPQRDHRIDLRCSARRYITSEKSNAQKANGGDRDGTCVGRLDTEQDAGKGLVERYRAEDT